MFIRGNTPFGVETPKKVHIGGIAARNTVVSLLVGFLEISEELKNPINFPVMKKFFREFKKTLGEFSYFRIFRTFSDISKKFSEMKKNFRIQKIVRAHQKDTLHLSVHFFIERDAIASRSIKK